MTKVVGTTTKLVTYDKCGKCDKSGHIITPGWMDGSGL